MTRYVLLTFIVIVYFVSCTNSVNVSVEEEVIKTLEQNNEQLNIEAHLMYYDLEYKTRSVETEAKAFYYLPKINAADSLLKNFYIALGEIFNNKNSEVELKKMLNVYISNILRLDIKFKEYIDNNFSYFKYDSVKPKEVLKRFEIGNYSSNNALNRELVKNKVTLIRNYFFKWCLGNTMLSCDYITYRFSAITSQNATKFKTNDSLIISAGIGGFIKENKATIVIDNDTIQSNYDGVAEYKVNVGNKKGEFTKNVSIIYFRPNGEKQHISKEIKYTVD